MEIISVNQTYFSYSIILNIKNHANLQYWIVCLSKKWELPQRLILMVELLLIVIYMYDKHINNAL